MSNKTAVKWLEYQFLSPATLYSHNYIMDKLKQAKAMEIDQMKHAFDVASMYDYDGGFEEYHEEFYGK